MNLEDIAKICHETNRAYCQVLGDNSQPPWENAPDWQKNSVIAGVKVYINDPTTTPERSHEGWMRIKEQEGWVYGDVKNPDQKQHPCMIPYNQLPPEQKRKDTLFLSVVKALSN